MIQHRTRAFSPNKSTTHEVGTVISAPLIAAAQANSKMLSEQTKFIMDFCFQETGENKYDPIMIELSITRGSLKAETDETTIVQNRMVFKVPSLTLIPLNSLGVDTVSIDFEMEITSQKTKSTMRTFGSEPKDEVELHGKISYDSREKRSSSRKAEGKTENTSKLKVNVHASSLPIPVGVSTLLDLYVKSVHPTPASDSEKTNETTQS